MAMFSLTMDTVLNTVLISISSFVLYCIYNSFINGGGGDIDKTRRRKQRKSVDHQTNNNRTDKDENDNYPKIDFTITQSLPIKNDPSERRLRYYEPNNQSKFITNLHEDGTTMLECFQRAARIVDDGKGFGKINKETRSVEWVSYASTLERAVNFGNGLLQLQQKPRSIIGLYSINRIEYVVAEYGSYTHSMIVAPIYSTLGPNVCTFIANQADIEVIVCDTIDRVSVILSQASKIDTLRYIVVMDQISDNDNVKEEAQKSNVQVYNFSDVEKLGIDNPAPKDNVPKPSDVAVINYTSGATGIPKGVILSHRNIVASASAMIYQTYEHILGKSDSFLSFLPLAHVMERVVQCAVLMQGVKIVFFSGDITNLLDDIQIVRPTIFTAVPRLINRVYDKVYQNIRGNFVKETLLRMALSAKLAAYKRKNFSNNTIWDKLIFNKIRQSLGGRIRIFCTGSASVDPLIAETIRTMFGCIFMGGYGCTECPCITLAIPYDERVDHNGPPLASAHIKLVDIPEMNYFASEGKGEILLQGPGVTSGYYKNEIETRKMFDENGWLRTGDVGAWTEDGTLQIIDRLKNFFKLSQGEFIAVEKLSVAYNNSLFISQLFVYGDSLKSYLVAIVVPDEEYLNTWCKVNNIDPNISVAQKCANKQIKEAIITDLNQIAEREQFNKLEYIKKIHLTTEQFTIDNGLITPTMKIKRVELHKHFSKQIEELYR